MELFRATALESRTGTSPGRPSEAVSMNDVTRILLKLEQRDPQAAEQPVPLVWVFARARLADALDPG